MNAVPILLLHGASVSRDTWDETKQQLMDRYCVWTSIFVVTATPKAAESFPVSIRVDAAKTQGELKPIWRFFGADEPNYAYMANGKKLVGELGELSPQHIFFRAHNLLTSGDVTPALKWGSTGAYSEDSEGNPIYNWTILDRIFDTYLERGVRPYSEMGFNSPVVLAASTRMETRNALVEEMETLAADSAARATPVNRIIRIISDRESMGFRIKDFAPLITKVGMASCAVTAAFSGGTLRGQRSLRETPVPRLNGAGTPQRGVPLPAASPYYELYPTGLVTNAMSFDYDPDPATPSGIMPGELMSYVLTADEITTLTGQLLVPNSMAQFAWSTAGQSPTAQQYLTSSSHSWGAYFEFNNSINASAGFEIASLKVGAGVDLKYNFNYTWSASESDQIQTGVTLSAASAQPAGAYTRYTYEAYLLAHDPQHTQDLITLLNSYNTPNNQALLSCIEPDSAPWMIVHGVLSYEQTPPSQGQESTAMTEFLRKYPGWKPRSFAKRNLKPQNNKYLAITKYYLIKSQEN
jgi:hypothetical protein